MKITKETALLVQGHTTVGQVTIPPGIYGKDPLLANALVWTDGMDTVAIPLDEEDRVNMIKELTDGLSEESIDAVKTHLHRGIAIAHEMPQSG